MRLLKIGVLAIACAAFAAATLGGCSASTAGEREEAVGTLNMNLVGKGSSGVSYRLRHATFDVTGPKSLSLSSETNAAAPSIEQELPAGDYLINLKSGWTLEQASGGMSSTVKAVLTSQNPVSFEIADQGKTAVVFQFKAGDDVVQLGDGTLDIAIAVNDGTPAATCTDNVKNGSETDIDCGGPTCAACAAGRACSLGADCQNRLCTAGVCSTCMDGIKDGSETDVDCGGFCTTHCGHGKGCLLNADCSSPLCNAGTCI
jgi:hypothetical protein